MLNVRNTTTVMPTQAIPHTFEANGTFAAPPGNRYDPITINVPEGGTPFEPQEFHITENGVTYPPDNVRATKIQVDVPDAHTDQPVEFTENGVYTTPENVRYDEITVDVPVPVDTEKLIDANGIYEPEDLERWSRVTVNVQGGGSESITENSPSWPFAAIPTSNGGIHMISAGNVVRITDILGVGSIGKKVILVLSSINFTGLSISSEFELLYSTGLLAFYYGIPTAYSSITVTGTTYCSAVEIADNFTPTIYNNLCGEGYPTNINTNYLKTSFAYKISAKLPTGYGIFVVGSSYDYVDEAYRPMAWEALNKFIVKPEIVLRRVAEYLEGGFTVWLKINPAAYNQYFIRGSVNGHLVSDGNLLSPPSNISSIFAYKEVPTWTTGTLSIAYIQLTEETET